MAEGIRSSVARRELTAASGEPADRPPGMRGFAEGAPGRTASTRGAIASFAWPEACRRRRTLRRGASDVRTWLGVLRVARDGADHASHYSRGGCDYVSGSCAPGHSLARAGYVPKSPSRLLERPNTVGWLSGVCRVELSSAEHLGSDCLPHARRGEVPRGGPHFRARQDITNWTPRACC
jgi:hypothetical protein